MRTDDLDRFERLFADVMAYYRQDRSDFTQGLFWSALAPFSFEEVSKAFERHAKDPDQGRFPPKVADLARILEGTTTDKAALAWGKTFGAMSSVGAYTDVVFDDPAIHAAVQDCGGWPTMCRIETDELSHLQRRFQNAYKAYAEKGAFDYPRRLAGDRSPDSEYEKIGMKPPKPAVVGDVELARLVYRGGGANGVKVSLVSLSDMASNRLSASSQVIHEE